MLLKKWLLIFLVFPFRVVSEAQPANCVFKPPQVIIHFGSGSIPDLNSKSLSSYERVGRSCPSDGYYSYVPATSRCFNDDWHTLSEDHTPGDANGNMLLVNAAPYGGEFMSIPVHGLKSNTMYELGLWVMNLCRPTDKCPSLLLPSLNIRLVTAEGKVVANIVTRNLPRVPEPRWDQHKAFFTTPANPTALRLVMMDNAPGGCGNDFALDDITFRECVKEEPKPTVSPKPKTVAIKPAPKQQAKKTPAPASKKESTGEISKLKTDTSFRTLAIVRHTPKIFPPAPMVLKTRSNELVKRIETGSGEIKINLYDNGEIDGDTVSIYHNNTLIKSRLRLSQKPITINIGINPGDPHHELVMVAENLGSIPPNTSVMIITTPAKRYSVFITSSEQKNAKVVFDLKE